MQTYVFIHGAWHAKWCWERVLTYFEKKGVPAIAVDLPGHGLDRTPFCEINLSHYVAWVINLLDHIATPVVLVGHSMAGAIISQIAECVPDKIAQLVYVAAFIPDNHTSLLVHAKQLTPTKLEKETMIIEKLCAIKLKKTSRLRDLFYNACTVADATRAISRLQIEPLQPFFMPLLLTNQNFGKVQKRYVVCMQDQVLLALDQEKIAQRAACELVSIAADHAPFYSAPAALCGAILAEA